MTTKGVRLVKPRLAHIAGVDHPAHQDEGWIVAKSLSGNQSTHSQEGHTMELESIIKSLSVEPTKENAAELFKSLKDTVVYLVEKAAEKEKATEATDTNTEELDTNVTKSDEEMGDAEMLASKSKKKADSASDKEDEEKDNDNDEDDVVKTKALNAQNAELNSIKKRLAQFEAKELLESTQAEVRKAAGALQTNTESFAKAIIAAGGVGTEIGKEILKSVKAISEQMAVGGDLRKDIGANGVSISSDLATANAQFKSIAKSISESENIPMTKALIEAARRNPELESILSGGAN